MLVRNGHHEEAIETINEIVARHADEFDDWISLAESQQALGRVDDAKKSLAEAEKKAATILAKQAGRVGDKRTQEKLQETIAKLRESLGVERK
jgi:predicted Zn-dependent protease